MPRPKSKTQKKIDNNIRLALTDVCELLLQDTPGFQWLTHHANYSNFPASLLITCVFDTEESQQRASEHSEYSEYSDERKLQSLIQAKLLSIGVKLTTPRQQIIFDSEQACAKQQQGDWDQRFSNRREITGPKGPSH